MSDAAEAVGVEPDPVADVEIADAWCAGRCACGHCRVGRGRGSRPTGRVVVAVALVAARWRAGRRWTAPPADGRVSVQPSGAVQRTTADPLRWKPPVGWLLLRSRGRWPMAKLRRCDSAAKSRQRGDVSPQEERSMANDADWVEDVKRWCLAGAESARSADAARSRVRKRVHRLRGCAPRAAGAPLARRPGLQRIASC